MSAELCKQSLQLTSFPDINATIEGIVQAGMGDAEVQFENCVKQGNAEQIGKVLEALVSATSPKTKAMAYVNLVPGFTQLSNDIDAKQFAAEQVETAMMYSFISEG